ncbi:MAG TPA: hypothetical protein VI386_34460 [Candidatus Sulfotelmatobacter sp.]
MKFPRRLSIFVVTLVFSALSLSAHAADGREPENSALTDYSPDNEPVGAPPQFMIPGPLRSFLRMAGISQKVMPEEVLPLLSRNAFVQGYQGGGHEMEFLILLRRYVVQARELASLAATQGMTLRVSNCENAKPLLLILGYHTRPNCGDPATSLQTADPERAFLTIDSGFPLSELEKALQGGKAFEYSFTPAAVPVLFAESDWTMASKKNHVEASKDLMDTLLSDPALARLYWAMSKLDPETGGFLRQSFGIRGLLPYAGVLDFYGSQICIRGGRVVVPGGPATESGWENLVGASPASPAAFIRRLLSRDKGWLVAYFDVLSRITREQQKYFTEPHRLQVFYEALRSQSSSLTATTGTFRPAPGLLLLVTRLQFGSDQQPLVPGSLEVWQDILRQKRDSAIVSAWRGRDARITTPDQIVQTMFALSRSTAIQKRLQTYLTICELDSGRSPEHHLAPATVRLLARKFEDFSDQYRIFSEFRELNDVSIVSFLEAAEALNNLSAPMRGNALGAMQANVGIWQILARQGEISRSQLNESWQRVIKPFAKVRSGAQIYDAGRISLEELFRTCNGKPKGSQDDIIELLAGPRQTTPQGKKIHQEVAGRIRSVLDAQRLVSLDTLFALGDALQEKAEGKSPGEYVIHLAGEVREFEMPRPIFSSGERTEWAPGIYNNHHTETEMRTDVAGVLKSPKASHAQLEQARGHLAFFLRDALVGLNYAYYEPPGSQALHNNPLFVRSHDFAAETVAGIKSVWQAPQLIGLGSPAGGGAHFVGSLADLPYVLADLEQDFITPENVQALIWKELTPNLLTNSVLPRWWDISDNELHAVALYQRGGEELLAASAKDDALRSRVMSILSERETPRQSEQVEQAIRTGELAPVMLRLTPADTFYLTAEFQRRYPGETATWGAASQELQELSRKHPDQINWKRLSHDFGVPHPSLTHTYGSELLNVRPMPPFSGEASRFLAESWDWPNLYWARLADETGHSAVTLNNLVPQLTRHMVEKIFATEFEDSPAILRAMRETGEDFRKGKIASVESASLDRQ